MFKRLVDKWKGINWREIKIHLMEWTLKICDFIWSVCQITGSFLFLVGLVVFVLTGNFYLLLLSASLIVGVVGLENVTLVVLRLNYRLKDLKKEEYGEVDSDSV